MAEELPKIDEPWTVDDTGPPLPFDDEADLTGFTVELLIIRPSGGLLTKTVTTVLSADGQITDATNGIGQFTFVTGDLVAGLNQECVLKFTSGAGIIEHTDRFLIDVVAEPAVPSP